MELKPRNTGSQKQPQTTEPQRIFGPLNFVCMAVCIALIVIGFALMAGPGSSEATGFNPDIFSTRRIVVGPTIAFLGFLLMAFAIIVKPDTLRRLKERGKSAE